MNDYLDHSLGVYNITAVHCSNGAYIFLFKPLHLSLDHKWQDFLLLVKMVKIPKVGIVVSFRPGSKYLLFTILQ